MTVIRYELELMSRLMDRAKTVCLAEGINLTTFVESAIREAVLNSERRSQHVRDALRSADDYPHKCDICGRTFKLPMHLGNHMVKSHDIKLQDEKPEVTKNGTVLTEEMIEGLADEAEKGYDVDKLVPVVGSEVQPEQFKLGVDPSLIEMEEPSVEIKVEFDPDDFSLDVPSF